MKSNKTLLFILKQGNLSYLRKIQKTQSNFGLWFGEPIIYRIEIQSIISNKDVLGRITEFNF